ncbi:hypothetical protein TYRP_019519 [Tyrophagus putrescentiae]|nr:hypothetical protein TYRP_019519 [Tyrophagus putrescentiae]
MALSFLAINFTAVTAEPKGEPEAIRECGNIHDLDMHQFPNNSIAVFINDECALNCTVDGRVMNTASINEGYICPRNVRGRCHRGTCVVPLNPDHHGDAVTQCGNLNHIDTHFFNNSGTHYVESECKVVCFINGQEASEHNINEGYQCPAEKSGRCKAGTCVLSHTLPTKPTTLATPKVTPPSTTPPTQKATPKPTTATKPTETPKPTTTPKPTPPPTAPPKTTPRVDTFENIEIERVSSRFIGGMMNDNSKVTNISVCYKTVPVRTFDRNACKYYCSSTEISCIIQSPERHFSRDQSYFLFNAWRSGNSIGDAYYPIRELFYIVKDEPGMMIAHNGRDNYNMNVITSIPLYNNEPMVGNLSLELELNYRRV